MMRKLSVLAVPEPVLNTPAEEIGDIDQEVLDLANNLAATMYSAGGVGLAAPQVGIGRRLLVADLNLNSVEEAPAASFDRKLLTLVNPKIIEQEGSQLRREKCLSVPGLTVQVKRAHKIVLEVSGPEGKTYTIVTKGFPASVLQHEIDHLDGITILDHAPPAKRKSYLRKLKKGK
jgi:peptide deformylase